MGTQFQATSNKSNTREVIQLVLRIAFVIFCAEVIVMLVLNALGNDIIPRQYEPLADAFLLTLLVSPVITTWIILPFIRRREETKNQLRHIAFHDSLTLLPNRYLMMERLKHSFSMSERSQHYGVVLFIDLDNFKPLNDRLGHDAGDDLLVSVAKRLTELLREEDTVARLGGDEFVVILANLGEEQEQALASAKSLADKIAARLAEPYQIKSHAHESSASFGGTLFPLSKDDTPTAVLKRADQAMYQTKERGRGKVTFQTEATL